MRMSAGGHFEIDILIPVVVFMVLQIYGSKWAHVMLNTVADWLRANTRPRTMAMYLRFADTKIATHGVHVAATTLSIVIILVVSLKKRTNSGQLFCIRVYNLY